MEDSRRKLSDSGSSQGQVPVGAKQVGEEVRRQDRAGKKITWEGEKARGPIKQWQSNVGLTHCVRKKGDKKSRSASKREADIQHWGISPVLTSPF